MGVESGIHEVEERLPLDPALSLLLQLSLSSSPFPRPDVGRTRARLTAHGEMSLTAKTNLT